VLCIPDKVSFKKWESACRLPYDVRLVYTVRLQFDLKYGSTVMCESDEVGLGMLDALLEYTEWNFQQVGGSGALVSCWSI
jgi:hypothetical protein